ncbi:type VI secretion system contractile sheath small subunit, partial [Piscirickettsia salmonis]|uniref:type VI secretion system contractile sheath small subunit n=1 Tax=Piscirickettsia salmonis TaxID=1238 RepID=UPI00056B88B4
LRNSALLKTRTYLGLLTPCLALHGSQRMKKLLLELQSVVDNKKEFRRKLNELLQDKQSVTQIKEQFNGFQNYRLPTDSQ